MQVGARIRKVRTHKGLTIPALAEMTGLSRGFISQVENDKTSVSLENLEKIAAALQVPVVNLLLQNEFAPELVRREQRLRMVYGNFGMVEAMTTGVNWQLQVVLVTMPPGAQTGGYAHTHEGEELLLVYQGMIRAVQGDFDVVLNPGDSLHLDGTVAHRFENAGSEEAVVFVSLTPPAPLPVTAIEDGA